MKFRRVFDSFNYAIQGIIHTLQTQKNMRFHFIIAIGVLILSLFQDFSRSELLVLFVSITLVLVLELVNSAVEAAVDLIANYYHPLARIAKNAAAGAVLIAAINAILVGYLLFFDRLKPLSSSIVEKVKQSPPHITFITLTVIMLIVIGVKAFSGRGTPLKGGMPSGHSALAFAISSIISLISKDALIATLSFIMAFMIAQSRVESKIHTVLETSVGGLIGILISIMIFQLFQ